MLPLEIYTLILLASNVFADPRPQRFNNVNSTITQTSTPPATLTSPFFAHDESTEKGFETSSRSRSWRVPGIESTETGWETIDGPPRSSTPPHVGSYPPDVIVTTESPIVIDISTYIENPNNPGAGGEGTQDPENNQNNPGGHAQTGSVPAVPQVTPGSDLLNDIISHIGSPQPVAQPTLQPAVQTSLNGGAPLPTGEAITLGGTTLTLTPGLSTTVGTGEEATSVGITTNDAGQTIIVVSSSGTAVSATVTKTAVTMTAPKTGFDAEITDIAKPGDEENSSSEGTALSTSSAGGAASVRRWEAEWWLGILVGIGISI